MKIIKQFTIGSNVFFKNFTDYFSKDIDELIICDELIDNKKCLNMKIKNKDIFLYKQMKKQEMIEFDLNSNVNMKAGKYLVPEFANYIGLTIEDLKVFKNMFENIDNKHFYEKLIFNFYIQNNSFSLTKNQLDEAYKEYLKHK